MVIAHGLAIPDPERRFLPTTERNDAGDAASEETADDLALDADSDLGTPQSLDEPPIPEVTAVPTPDDATGNSLRDDERDRAAGALATNDDAPDDAASGDDAGDERDKARDTGTNAADRGATPDDPADERPPSATPSTSTPTPQPRSSPSPSPSPSPTASEPSEVPQPTQSSSLIVPGTDDRDHDDRYRDTWNPYWWEQDRDHHGDDRDGDHHGDDDDRHRRRR
jgi:hypothetical protein